MKCGIVLGRADLDIHNLQVAVKEHGRRHFLAPHGNLSNGSISLLDFVSRTVNLRDLDPFARICRSSEKVAVEAFRLLCTQQGRW